MSHISNNLTRWKVTDAMLTRASLTPGTSTTLLPGFQANYCENASIVPAEMRLQRSTSNPLNANNNGSQNILVDVDGGGAVASPGISLVSSSMKGRRWSREHDTLLRELAVLENPVLIRCL